MQSSGWLSVLETSAVAKMGTSTAVTVTQPSILIIYQPWTMRFKITFQPKSPALEFVDVLDPLVELSLLRLPTLMTLTCAQGTWLQNHKFVKNDWPNIVLRCGAKVFEAEKVATGVGPFHKSCYRCRNMSFPALDFPIFRTMWILPIKTIQVCWVSSLSESKVLQWWARWGDILHSVLSGKKKLFTICCAIAGRQQKTLWEFEVQCHKSHSKLLLRYQRN